MADREYHYVITLQFQREGQMGLAQNTITGTRRARRGETRQDLYQGILADAYDSLGVTEAVTLFFDLARNDL